MPRKSPQRPPGATAARDAVVISHLHIVRPIARQIAKAAHVRPDLDELIAEGMLALVQAAERFDADRGCSFATYATFRVRGAMLELLRRAHLREASHLVIDQRDAAPGPTIEQILDRRRRSRMLAQGLSRLTAAQRVVIGALYHEPAPNQSQPRGRWRRKNQVRADHDSAIQELRRWMRDAA